MVGIWPLLGGSGPVAGCVGWYLEVDQCRASTQLRPSLGTGPASESRPGLPLALRSTAPDLLLLLANFLICIFPSGPAH